MKAQREEDCKKAQGPKTIIDRQNNQEPVRRMKGREKNYINTQHNPLEPGCDTGEREARDRE